MVPSWLSLPKHFHNWIYSNNKICFFFLMCVKFLFIYNIMSFDLFSHATFSGIFHSFFDFCFWSFLFICVVHVVHIYRNGQNKWALRQRFLAMEQVVVCFSCFLVVKKKRKSVRAVNSFFTWQICPTCSLFMLNILYQYISLAFLTTTKHSKHTLMQKKSMHWSMPWKALKMLTKISGNIFISCIKISSQGYIKFLKDIGLF